MAAADSMPVRTLTFACDFFWSEVMWLTLCLDTNVAQADMAEMKSKQFDEDAAVKVHRIRITLTSRNVKNLEKGELIYSISCQAL